jgi:flagellar protein FlgJ
MLRYPPGLAQPPQLGGDEEEEDPYAAPYSGEGSSFDYPLDIPDPVDSEQLPSDIGDDSFDFADYPTDSDLDVTDSRWQDALDELIALREEQEAEAELTANEEEDSQLEAELEAEMAELDAAELESTDGGNDPDLSLEGSDLDLPEEDGDTEEPALAGPPAGPEGSAATGATAADLDHSSREAFIVSLRPHAESASARTGIPADHLIAMALNERGWQNDSPDFNFGGIKGPGKVHDTWEVVNGQRVNTRDSFRTYTSPEEGLTAVGEFLRDNSRYASALAEFKRTGDADQLFRNINEAGYATDPIWGDKVNQIAREVSGVGSVGAGQGKNTPPSSALGIRSGSGFKVRPLSRETAAPPEPELPPIAEHLEAVAQAVYGKAYTELDGDEQSKVLQLVIRQRKEKEGQAPAPTPAADPAVPSPTPTPAPSPSGGGAFDYPLDVPQPAPPGTPAVPGTPPKRRNPPGYWEGQRPPDTSTGEYDSTDVWEWAQDNKKPTKISDAELFSIVGLAVWGKSYAAQDGAERKVTQKVLGGLDTAARNAHGKSFRDLDNDQRAALLKMVGNSIPIPPADPMDDPATRAKIIRAEQQGNKAKAEQIRKEAKVAMEQRQKATLERQERNRADSIARSNANRAASWDRSDRIRGITWDRADRLREEAIERAEVNRQRSWDRQDLRRDQSWARSDAIRLANQARQDKLRADTWGRQDRQRTMKVMTDQPNPLTATLGTTRNGQGSIPSWATLSLVLSPEDRNALSQAWQGGSLGQNAITHPRLSRAMAAFPFSGSAPEWLAIAQSLWAQDSSSRTSANAGGGTARPSTRTNLPQVRQRVIRRR